ncbi:MAG TPA: hypothetical protein VFX49_00845 [Chloroflexota bacterium]|nr:hypothetical protein [Chloroflexota bacterium]
MLRSIQWCAISNTRTAVQEERAELSRYRADLTAALAPPQVGLLCGALAGFLVFFVPVVIVAGSMLLISITFNFGIVPLQLLVRVFQIRVPRGAPVAPATVQPTARPTELPPLPPQGIEGTDAGDGVGLAAVALVLFWPVAMLGIGALVAALYRLRRRRQLDALRRAPLDLSVFPEVALFYVLTAGAGVLVGVGTFVALGANVIFAWAGFLIWRWLYDRAVWRAAPEAVRAEAAALLDRERDYRKRARESG